MNIELDHGKALAAIRADITATGSSQWLYRTGGGYATSSLVPAKIDLPAFSTATEYDLDDIGNLIEIAHVTTATSSKS